MTTKNQARAVVYGLACGDALGWPTEFMSMPAIWNKYGKNGITDLSQTKGEFTDDSQMTIALAEGLLDALRETPVVNMSPTDALADPNYVMPRVAERFLEWSVSPENNRAPGTSCMGGCRRLGDGLPWNKSGVPGALGCGAVMRVAPIGLVYENRETIRKIAEASAITTHGSEPAARSAHLGALAIRLALDGMQPREILDKLVETLSGVLTPATQNLMSLLVSIPGLVNLTMSGRLQTWEVMDRDKLGQSWVADEALASALYCVLLADKRGEGYVDAVNYGANTPGDSDSIACIAGGIAGALWGIGSGLDSRGIPTEWVDMIEDSAKLGDLADRLADASVSLASE